MEVEWFEEMHSSDMDYAIFNTNFNTTSPST